MVDSTTGSYELRAEHFEEMVKGFALAQFKMKQLVMESSSNSWIETYYRENGGELTAQATRSVAGIPRLAQFPYGEVTWQKVQAYISKYGMEGVVSYEDSITDNIDVVAREMLRIARAVAYAVDYNIYCTLYGAAGNTLALTAGYEWDAVTIANRDPITDLLKAKRELEIDNFDTSNCILCVNPTDKANIISNSKVLNSPNFKFLTGSDAGNGRIAQLVGCTIIESNVVGVVTAGVSSGTDAALLVIPKECGTWKATAPLQVFTIEDKGVKYTIRAFEMGVCQATTPNAICTITNTKA